MVRVNADGGPWETWTPLGQARSLHHVVFGDDDHIYAIAGDVPGCRSTTSVERLYTAPRIFSDCNVNGFSDQSDINCGLSPDGNGNGIPDECEDSDSDGVPDDEDACSESDLGETIVIDGCDTGVENPLFEDGCTMTDLVMLCAEDANNHGQFVSCVAHLANEWKHDGLITGGQKGAIQSCAAQAGIP